MIFSGHEFIKFIRKILNNLLIIVFLNFYTAETMGFRKTRLTRFFIQKVKIAAGLIPKYALVKIAEVK